MNLNRSILPIAVVTLLVACSQQGEGERCFYDNADCASGLVCIESKDLETEYASEFPADRCCPSDERASSDPRCKRKDESDDTTTTGTAGAPGTTGNAAGAGSGGMSSAGAGGESAGAAGVMSETAGSAGAGT